MEKRELDAIVKKEFLIAHSFSNSEVNASRSFYYDETARGNYSCNRGGRDDRFNSDFPYWLIALISAMTLLLIILFF